jgi:hypothetical protein
MFPVIKKGVSADVPLGVFDRYKYYAVRTYIVAGEIVKLSPSWGGEYQILCRNSCTDGTYNAFISNKDLASILFSPKATT